MDAKDFRIGNKLSMRFTSALKGGKSYWAVGTMNERDFAGIIEFPGNYKPILLTEVWMLRLGYSFNGESWFCPNKVIGLTRYFNFLIWPPSGGGGGGYFGQIEIKYVHQLQNLHFALTGQELTFTEHGQTPL